MKGAPTSLLTKKKSNMDYGRYGLYFVLPFSIALLVLKFVPMLYTVSLSFDKWNGLDDRVFIGLENYTRLLSDKNFYTAIWNTFYIWLLNVVPRMGVALLCALVFANSSLKGKKFFKAVYYFPNLVTSSAIAVLAYLALDYQSGFVNDVLLRARLISEPINWLRFSATAQGSVAFLIWWMWFGYAAILFTTGIMSIPQELVECAQVDGANGWRRFWSIIMPLLRPTFSYVFITSLIGGLQNFEIPRLITDGRGAPGKALLTVVMQMYNLTFQSNQYGYGATYAVGLFVIIAIISGLTFRMVNGKNLDEEANV